MKRLKKICFPLLQLNLVNDFHHSLIYLINILNYKVKRQGMRHIFIKELLINRKKKNLQQKNKQTDQNKTLVNITNLMVNIRMMDKKNQTMHTIMF